MSREHWYAGKVTKEETSWDNLAKKLNPSRKKQTIPKPRITTKPRISFSAEWVSQACSEWRFWSCLSPARLHAPILHSRQSEYQFYHESILSPRISMLTRRIWSWTMSSWAGSLNPSTDRPWLTCTGYDLHRPLVRSTARKSTYWIESPENGVLGGCLMPHEDGSLEATLGSMLLIYTWELGTWCFCSTG